MFSDCGQSYFVSRGNSFYLTFFSFGLKAHLTHLSVYLPFTLLPYNWLHPFLHCSHMYAFISCSCIIQFYLNSLVRTSLPYRSAQRALLSSRLLIFFHRDTDAPATLGYSLHTVRVHYPHENITQDH